MEGHRRWEVLERKNARIRSLQNQLSGRLLRMIRDKEVRFHNAVLVAFLPKN